MHQSTVVTFTLLSCARIYRASFHENKPKTLIFSLRKRAFWACFCENWLYKFGHWYHAKNVSTKATFLSGFYLSKQLCVLKIENFKNVCPHASFLSIRAPKYSHIKHAACTARYTLHYIFYALMEHLRYL